MASKKKKEGKMKRGLLVVIAMLLVVSLVAIGCAAPAPAPPPVAPAMEPLKVKFSTAYPPPPDASGIGKQWFMDQITERSGGLITWEVFWGGALAKPLEHLDIIGAGVADMGAAPLGAWSDRAPLSHFDYAFLFGPPDPEMVSAAMLQIYDEFPQFQEQIADDNVRINHNNAWDTYDINSVEPIRTLGDFKGKVIALWGKYYPKAIEVVGGTGVPGPMPERYMQLKLGVFDGALQPIEQTVVLKHYEITKYTTIASTGAHMPHEIIMNLDFWNALTPAQQQLFTETGRDTMAWHSANIKKLRGIRLEQLIGHGVTIYKLSEADIATWTNLMPDMPAAWAEDMEALGYPGFEIARRWQQITSDMGFDWPRRWAGW